MSREIKFRAWHKCEKKMLNLTKINFLSGAAWSDPESKPHIMCHENPECCILMQFIGLKDKNGVEIYEGDIIQYEYNSLLRFVKWHDEFAGYVFTYRPDLGDSDKLCEGLIRSFKPEIIGNIYESKRLLNQ